MDGGTVLRRPWVVELRGTLSLLLHHDQDYEVRWRLVWLALAQATQAGLRGGVRIDREEPDWPVVYLDLPQPDGSTAQVSWHQPRYEGAWDGHTTDVKHARVRAYLEGAEP